MPKDRKHQARPDVEARRVQLSAERAELAEAIARRKETEADIAALERAIDENSEKGYALNRQIEKAQREVESVGDRKKALVASALGDTATIEAIEASRAALAAAEKKKEATIEMGQALREALAEKKQLLAIRELNVHDAVHQTLAVDPALLAVVEEFNEVKIRYANLLAVIFAFSYEKSILPRGSAAIHTDTAEYVGPWLSAYRRLSDDPLTALPNL